MTPTLGNSLAAEQQALIPTLKAALKKPPQIVLAYLDACSVSSVNGGGGTVVFPFAPAGGTERGWWSNGTYLNYKNVPVALRDNELRVLATLPGFVELFSRSDLVKGLDVVSVPALDGTERASLPFYWGVHWKGWRSGHLYVTLFCAQHREAAVHALEHLKAETELPDYSPCSGLIDPSECLELGECTELPAEHEAKKIIYLSNPAEPAPIGSD